VWGARKVMIFLSHQEEAFLYQDLTKKEAEHRKLLFFHHFPFQRYLRTFGRISGPQDISFQRPDPGVTVSCRKGHLSAEM